MRKLAAWVTLLGGVCVLAGGCDRAASQQASASRNIEEALSAMERAGRGYVPTQGPHADAETLDAYRQATLAEAMAPLQAAIDAGSPSQQVAAQRLQSGIDASAARALTREATDTYASLAARAAAVSDFVTAVGLAESRVGMFQRDDTQTLAELASQAADLQDQRRALQQQVGSLQNRIDDLRAEYESTLDAANAALAEAEAMRQEAFTLQGDAKYDLLDRAAQRQRDGASRSFEAEKTQARLDELAVELDLLELRERLVSQAIEQVRQQAAATRQAGETIAQQRSQAEADRAEAVEALAQEYEQLVRAYEQSVSRKFETAASRVDAGVEALSRAADRASREVRDAVQQELLVRLIDQAHVLTQHAAVIGGFASTVGLVADAARRLGLEDAPVYTQRAEALAATQAQLIERARAAIDQGRQIAQPMAESAPEGSARAQFARAQLDHLDAFTQRLDGVELK